MTSGDEPGPLADLEVTETRSRLLEPADESCIALLHFLRSSDLPAVPQRLLFADYAARRFLLIPGLRAAMDEEFFAHYLPDMGPLRGLGSLRGAQESLTGDETLALEDPTVPGRPVGHPSTDDAQRPAPGGTAPNRTAGDQIVDLVSRPVVDIAIIAAAGTELHAVRDVFRPVEKSSSNGGQPVYRATVARDGSSDQLTVAILPTGGHSEAEPVRSAVDVFQFCEPGALFLVGVGSGDKRRVKLGDVVVPQSIHRHPGGRLRIPGDMQFNLGCYDPDSAGFPRELRTILKKVGKDHLPPRMPSRFQPRVLFNAAVLSSSAARPAGSGHVAGGQVGETEFPIAMVDNDSWDFGSASNGRWWAILKGVSDFGDRKTRDKWHYLAAVSAALCLKNFLQKEYVPPQGLVF
ncbi:hypothetical protein ACQP2Y_15025 [Actinoplanes sp. CA-051413]|uniref:hypothetical protein n=1 Tax=Actinoplanes sp. CA-051413 TaxID=3239899 RepID=UPI003D957427